MLLSEFLANKYGKKSTFIVCLALTALLTAAFFIPASDAIELFFILCALKSLA
jgi:Na+/melibiose symporter-like transporter